MSGPATSVSHPPLHVTCESSGRVKLEAGPLAGALVRSPGGWRVEGFGELDGSALEASVDHIVLTPGGTTTATVRAAGEPGCRDVVLQDGRIFCIRGRELRGWQVSGAFFVARRDTGHWIVEATPAGGGIADPDRLRLLLAVDLVGVMSE